MSHAPEAAVCMNACLCVIWGDGVSQVLTTGGAEQPGVCARRSNDRPACSVGTTDAGMCLLPRASTRMQSGEPRAPCAVSRSLYHLVQPRPLPALCTVRVSVCGKGLPPRVCECRAPCVCRLGVM
jgi:hypothetical protein